MFIESYNPNSPLFQHQNMVKKFDYLTLTIKGNLQINKFTEQEFISNVKDIIAKWDSQLLKTYSRETKSLKASLRSPAATIIENPTLRMGYYHLFTCCLYDRVATGLALFSNLLNLMQREKFILKTSPQKYLQAATLSKIAVASQTLLKTKEIEIIHNVNANLKKLYALNLNKSGFQEIYDLAAEIFSSTALLEGRASIIISHNIIDVPAELSQSMIDNQWESIPNKERASIPNEENFDEWELILDNDEKKEAHKAFNLCPELIEGRIFSCSETKNITEENSAEALQFQSLSEAFWSKEGNEVIQQAAMFLLESINVEEGVKDELFDLLFAYIESKSTTFPLLAAVLPMLRKSAEQVSHEFLRTFLKEMIRNLAWDRLEDGFYKNILDTLLPYTSDSPSSKSASLKALFSRACTGLHLFLCDYNKCLESLPATLTIEEEEIRLLNMMHSCMLEKNFSLLNFEELNRSFINRQFQETVKELMPFLMRFEENVHEVEQNIYRFIFSTYLTRILKQLFSPDSIFSLLSLSLDESNKNSLWELTTEFQESNIKFEKPFSEEFNVTWHKIFHEIFRSLGMPQILQSVLTSFSDSLKDTIKILEKAVQLFLNSACNTKRNDFMLMPILFLHQSILEYQHTEKEQANFTQSVMYNSPAFRDIKKHLEGGIKGKPQDIFSEIANKQIPSSMSLTIKLLPIQEIRKKLSDRLYRLSQQDLLLKISFIYLANAITKG